MIRLLTLVILQLCLLSSISFAQTVELGKDGYLFIEDEFYPLSDKQIDTTSKALKRTVDALNSQGIRVVVAIVPTKASIYPEYIIGHRDYLRQFGERYYSIVAGLGKLGVNIFNVKNKVLSLKHSPSMDVWLKRDTHWTAYSGFQVGVSIGNFISKKGWDQGLEKTKITSTWVEDIYATDLSRILLSQHFVAGIAKNEVITSPVASITDIGLTDAISTPVALVGSSYSLLPRPGLSVGLSDALQTPVLNYGVDGGGVWGGMINFVHSDSFLNGSVKILVWEIAERNYGMSDPEGGLENLLLDINRQHLP